MFKFFFFEGSQIMAFDWKSTEQYNILPNMLMVPKKMANCDKIAFISTCVLNYWMTINEASSYVVLACVFKTPLTYYENEAHLALVL